MNLLLASYLTTQVWSWDKLPDTDVVAYRVYWNQIGTSWCANAKVEVPASTNCDATTCWADVPEPVGALVFFVIVGVDEAGNVSNTEHGPIVACP